MFKIRKPTTGPQQAPAPRSGALGADTVAAGSVVATAAFASGGLLTQTVLVPMWNGSAAAHPLHPGQQGPAGSGLSGGRGAG